jgi:hypothetical protein
MNLHDSAPPSGKMIIQASVFEVLNRAGRLASIPPDDVMTARELLREIVRREGENEQPIRRTTEILQERRSTVELAWIEGLELHPAYGRDAIWRSMVAMRRMWYVLINFGFFPEVTAEADRIWDHLRQTLTIQATSARA